MRHKDPSLMESIRSYVGDFFLNSERMPTTTEIANAMNIARSTSYNYLVAMDKEGMLDYKDGEIRISSMEKLSTGRSMVRALGRIPCGEPTLEEPDVLFVTSLPSAIFGTEPKFLLYASGDSMEDAGIFDGDLLVIKKQPTAKRGDIVVALDENGENTLKCYDGIDNATGYAVLKYQNKAVYGDKKIFVRELVCQGVLSHIIKSV